MPNKKTKLARELEDLQVRALKNIIDRVAARLDRAVRPRRSRRVKRS